METQGGDPTDREQVDPEQEVQGEEAEGQPSTDPTIHYEDVDPNAVGQPTEEPRTDPTEEIKQRYQESGGAERPAAEEEREVEQQVQGDTTGTAGGDQRAEAQQEREQESQEQESR